MRGRDPSSSPSSDSTGSEGDPSWTLSLTGTMTCFLAAISWCNRLKTLVLAPSDVISKECLYYIVLAKQ